MTAGDGVVHSELPDPEFQKKGGLMHGLQLWVNLPKKDKRMRPRYQEIPAGADPAAKSADGTVSVKVLAGEALGQKAVIETRTPILYLHFTVEPGGRVTQPVPEGFNVFAYVLSGEGRFGKDGTRGAEGDCVIFGKGGGDVAIEAVSRLDVLAHRRPAAERARRPLRPVRHEHEGRDRRGVRGLRGRADGIDRARGRLRPPRRRARPAS